MTKRKNPEIDSRTVLKTHCPHGHPYDEKNTGVRATGVRWCKTCVNESTRRNDSRRKRDDPETHREKGRRRLRQWLQIPENREKSQMKLKGWIDRNYEWTRVRFCLSKYGLTLDQYHALYESSDFACKVCGGDERLGVDHHHGSGKVMSVLCGKCNSGLGYFKDDPAALRAAANYIERQHARIGIG